MTAMPVPMPVPTYASPADAILGLPAGEPGADITARFVYRVPCWMGDRARILLDQDGFKIWGISIRVNRPATLIRRTGVVTVLGPRDMVERYLRYFEISLPQDVI